VPGEQAQFEHSWSIRTLIKIKTDEARRIAANIAKLPERKR
jgi:hypothetical protein